MKSLIIWMIFLFIFQPNQVSVPCFFYTYFKLFCRLWFVRLKNVLIRATKNSPQLNKFAVFSIFSHCSAQIVRIFLSFPVQLAAKQRKVEKEKETLIGKWKGYHPACMACGNPLYLLTRQVDGGAEDSPPPHSHTPFDQFEAAVVVL